MNILKSWKLKALLATLLIVGLLLIPSFGDANSCDWLEGYTYRKLIPITGSAGAGTDYQVPLTVHSDSATEEQTAITSAYPLYSGSKTRCGQKLTISNRAITKLTFRMADVGSPSGDVTFTIRQLDDTILASKVWGDAGDLGAVSNWREVTLDTPILVNEEVRISAEFTGGDASNYAWVAYQNTDVKASEGLSYYDGSWTDEDGNGNDYDCAYKYSYTGGNGVVGLSNYCTNFPNDIRFTDDDGVTELDHWSKDLTTDPVKFWIEVADDLGSNQSICIYFGKSGASSGSNGTNTFIIFNSGDTVTGWTDVTLTGKNNIDWAVNSGKVRATAGANGAGAFLFCDTQTGVNNWRLHADIIAQDGLVATNYQQGFVHKTTQAAADDGQARWLDISSYDKWAVKDEAGGQTFSDPGGAFDASITHEYILIRVGNDSKLYVDGALKVTHTKASWLPQYIGLFAYMAAANHWVDFSNIFVTKYIDPEPSVGTPGNREARGISYGYIIG